LKLFAQFTLICLVPAVVGIAASLVAGRWILRVFLSEEYVPHVDVLHIVMLAMTLNFLIVTSGIAITAMRRFRSALIPAVAGALISLVFSWLLIPAHEIHGAAWVLVIGAGVGWILRLLVIAHALPCNRESNVINIAASMSLTSDKDSR